MPSTRVHRPVRSCRAINPAGWFFVAVPVLGVVGAMVSFAFAMN